MPPTRRYSDAQREALLQATVVDGLSIAEAVRRAGAGRLPGTDAFAIPYQTASTIVNGRRRAFAVSAPDRAHAALNRAALKIADRALKATEKLEEDAEPVAIKRAADAVFAARRALGAAARNPTSQTPEEPDEPDEKPPGEPDPLTALVALANTQQANGATSTLETQ